MSGEKHGADWSGSLPGEPASCRCGYNGTPEECAQSRTPVPSEVAETPAGEREVEALRRVASTAIRDTRPLTLEQRFAEAVLRSDWLAAHDDRVRREEGERIAQAIERQESCGIADRGHDGCYVADSLAIARAASVGRGEGL